MTAVQTRWPKKHQWASIVAFLILATLPNCYGRELTRPALAGAPGGGTPADTTSGSSGGGQGSAPRAASVTVTPSSATLAVGGTVNLGAEVRDGNGDVLPNRPISWSSADPASASVDSNGVVTALVVPPSGTVGITATSDTASGSATITVQALPPVVASVTVTPSAATLDVGSTINLSAVVRDPNGDVIGSPSITWSSADPASASVDASGLVTALRVPASGTVDITATSDTASGSATITVQVVVASVTVTPSAATLVVGSTINLSAEVRSSTGDVMANPSIAWSSADPTSASVDGNGVVTALGVPASPSGTVDITATSDTASGSATITVQAPPPPVAVGGAAAPELLPVATGQLPDFGQYPGLGLGAGQTYADPVTGVTVLKLTDGNTPFTGNARGLPDYSEGGPFISQPWQDGAGETFYTVYVLIGSGPSTHYLVDVKFSDMTSSNWRQFSTGMTNRDVLWAWSLNPATPRVGYGIHMPGSATIRKFDTDRMVEVSGGGFPRTISGASRLGWFQISVNDTWLVFQDSGASTVYAWQPASNTLHTWQINDLDEPHMDRDGGFVYIVERQSCGPINRKSATALYSTATGTQVPLGLNITVDGWLAGCETNLHNTHPAGLRGFMVSMNPHLSFGKDGRHSYRYDPVNKTIAFTHDERDVFTSSGHRAGQWVFGNRTGTGQWYLISNWGTGGQSPAFQTAIGFVPADLSDSPRLLAHHYSEANLQYFAQPHATISPDGKLVLWGSTMNGGGRIDAFLARVPTQ